MRAIVVTEFGGPEVLELQDVPAPDGELLVDVAVAGVNYRDVYERTGRYGGGPPPGGGGAGGRRAAAGRRRRGGRPRRRDRRARRLGERAGELCGTGCRPARPGGADSGGR